MISDSFKKYNISYEDASKDTIAFRQGIVKFMEELEETNRWLESMSRGLKAYGDDYISIFI